MPRFGKVLVISLITLLTTACGKAEKTIDTTRPIIFALTVADMDNSMNWYEKVLGFVPDTVMNFPGYGLSVGMMHQGDFYLEFVQFEHDLSPTEIDFPEGSSALNGFYKIGFQTTDIEGLYRHLSRESDVSIVAPLDDLMPVNGHPWPDQYFLITDPDGNYVQLFSSPPDQKPPTTSLSPFLIASSSQDLDASILWYRKNLGAWLMGRVGQQGNERAIMSLNGLIIELGEFDGYVPFDSIQTVKDISLSQVHGIRKLSFLTPDIQMLYKRLSKGGIAFDFDLTEQKSLVGDRYFMLSDDAGNGIQFIERTHPRPLSEQRGDKMLTF